jgi:hypothetical protein
MKHYTSKEVNRIKQEIRTGKPLPIIADELSVEFNRPLSGLYTKIVLLARQTRKIHNTWTGPTRKTRGRKPKALRPATVQEVIDFEPLKGSLMENFDKRIVEIIEDIEATEAAQAFKEICEEIVEKPIERQPAEIGIEVPVGVMAFTGTPSKIVVYQDHVRYYFDN